MSVRLQVRRVYVTNAHTQACVSSRSTTIPYEARLAKYALVVLPKHHFSASGALKQSHLTSVNLLVYLFDLNGLPTVAHTNNVFQDTSMTARISARRIS